LTAANRINAWCHHLYKHNIYPIVVTRDWTGLELSEQDRLKNSGDQVRIVKNLTHEIHYIPYHECIRDKAFQKSMNSSTWKMISKVLTLVSLVRGLISIKTIRFANLYDYTLNYLKSDKAISTLIVSVDPFEQLHFAYELKKKLPHINWIADYRDDWTTTEVHSTPFRFILQQFEKKWVATASCIISVSPYYTSKISQLIGVPGETVYNGFDSESYTGLSNILLDSDKFVITYNGTLYPTQPIELFLDAFISVIKETRGLKLFLQFPGLAFNKQSALRVREQLKGYEDYFIIYDRLPKEVVIDMQLNSDLLLMIAHRGIKGIPSSKVFEYIGLRKKFLVCPGDEDILEEIAVKSTMGIVCNTSESVKNKLQEMMELKLKDSTQVVYDKESVMKYSVEHQVAHLARIIHKI
jgi:glycosyltransferase involved in cell wall biosynthesis